MKFYDLYYLQENQTPLIDNILSSGKVPSSQPTYININKEPYRSVVVNNLQILPNNTWTFNLKSIEDQNKYICTYIKDSSNLSAKLSIQYIPLFKHELTDKELNFAEIKRQYKLSDNLIKQLSNTISHKEFKSLILFTYNIYQDNLQDNINISKTKSKLVIFNNIKNLDLSKFENYIQQFHSQLVGELDLQPNIEIKAKEA